MEEMLDETEPTSPPPRAALSPWPLLAMLVAACLCWFGFQGWQLQREHRNLLEIRASSEAPLEQARKRRAQLESIMARTYELAQKGNPRATLILQELARRGVTINPAPTGPAPSGPAPAAPAPTK
jgi:hypothetical protein